MLTLTATDAKTRFGQVLESALVEPVAIEKNGRQLAFVVSSQEYHRLQEAEDALWGIRAKMAEAGGFLTLKQSNDWLARMGAKLSA
jgi:prevent-host-death family protein